MVSMRVPGITEGLEGFKERAAAVGLGRVRVIKIYAEDAEVSAAFRHRGNGGYVNLAFPVPGSLGNLQRRRSGS